MIKLFPELSSSTNISFTIPSSKGLRRFKCSNPIPAPLTDSMCVRALMKDRIRHNLGIISDATVRIVPKLIVVLSDKQERDRMWSTTYSRKLTAIMLSHRLSSKEEAGYLCIKNLLDDHLVPKVPLYAMHLNKWGTFLSRCRRQRHSSSMQFSDSNDDDETGMSLTMSNIVRPTYYLPNGSSTREGLSNMALKSGIRNDSSSYFNSDSSSESSCIESI
jgi:hypothetical protein